MKRSKKYAEKCFNYWVENGGDYSHYVLSQEELDTLIDIAFGEGVEYCRNGFKSPGTAARGWQRLIGILTGKT